MLFIHEGFNLLFSGAPFPGYQANLNGDEKNTEVTGISARGIILKAGFVPRCINILRKLRKNFT